MATTIHHKPAAAKITGDFPYPGQARTKLKSTMKSMKNKNFMPFMVQYLLA
jgi:hypothetical protein